MEKLWLQFPTIAAIAAIFWLATLTTLYYVKHGRREALIYIQTILGIVVLGIFIGALWHGLERPPLRTLGETRLWYSLFLPIIGLVTYARWHYKWFLAYSLGMAMLFLGINLMHPETYYKALMPALQSPWFVPHVVVYIFAYALLAASSLVALRELWQLYAGGKSNLQLADNLVYAGFALLTMGLLFGALWAKEAWGHYWTWDPKETWALLSWLVYLVYIHLRYNHQQSTKTALWILALAFVLLLICWFGINYLPSAQTSVHVYSS
jgi:ABC-type transport system involved in cytochrome c biogenesis permease subunit